MSHAENFIKPYWENQMFDGMKKLFPVNKTLCFNAVPVGKTLENIQEKDILGKDEKLSKAYAVIKVAADRVHKDIIEKAMNGFRLKYESDGKNDSVQDYAFVATDASLSQKDREKAVAAISEKLKRQVENAFNNLTYTIKNGKKAGERVAMTAAVSSKKLFEEILPGIVTEEEKPALGRMHKFVTYMYPYFDARARLYKAKEKGHTVPVRIVEDNLPIHVHNIVTAELLPDEIFEKFSEDEYMKRFLKENTFAKSLEEIFTFSYATLTNSQSAIDAYNTVIGGVSENKDVRHPGVNELINLYNQAHPKQKKVPFLKKLKKQILSDRQTHSWIPEEIKDDLQVLDIVKTLKEAADNLAGNIATFGNFTADKSMIFVDMKRIADYSMKAFGRWSTAEYALKNLLRERNPRKRREGDKGYAKRIDKLYKNLTYVSVEDIEDAARLNGSELQRDFETILTEFVSKNIYDAFAQYTSLDTVARIGSGKPLGQPLGQTNDLEHGAGKYIRTFLDNLNDAKKTLSIFTEKGVIEPLDENFYDLMVRANRDFAEALTPGYNSIRNYLTKKPYSQDKIRLTFGSSCFLEGWDQSVIENKRGVIFKEGSKYYLGIIPSHNRKVLSMKDFLDEASSLKLRVEKKAMAAHTTLPRITFSKNPESVFELNPKASVLYWSNKPVNEYTPEEVALMVDQYKAMIRGNKKWEVLGFEFKETSEYKRLDDFFKDFDAQSFMEKYMGVSKDYIRGAVNSGDLYLFEITCQDMLEGHHGKDGDFKVLLEEALSGRDDSCCRINGGAALYFRKRSLDPIVTHPKGQPIALKNPANAGRTRTFHYNIIKDNRYTEDRFAFHLPVTVYPDADEKGAEKINRTVQDAIRKNRGTYVLGINRGERHLLSIAVVAPGGDIIEQRDLNILGGYDYHYALTNRAKENKANQQNWCGKKDIKNMKEGYLSVAVGEVVRLVKKYNCIVALERLDKDFKDRRRAIESNVYEKFERMLISRLALMTDKDVTGSERIKDALQLTDPCKNEQDRTKFPQNGIVFLMNPHYITNIDPFTGFINRLELFYRSNKDCEDYFSKMDSFRYDRRTGRFVLEFRYSKVHPEKETGNADKKWTVETYGERIKNELDFANNPKGTWVDHHHDLSEEMKALFIDNGIQYEDGKNLVPVICHGQSSEFWKKFYELLWLTMQNTSWDSEKKEFRIIGCTADRMGRFYDSRLAPDTMPRDADVLAAWNLAKKAQMAMNRIREAEAGSVKSIVVTLEEWLMETQKE